MPNHPPHDTGFGVNACTTHAATYVTTRDQPRSEMPGLCELTHASLHLPAMAALWASLCTHQPQCCLDHKPMDALPSSLSAKLTASQTCGQRLETLPGSLLLYTMRQLRMKFSSCALESAPGMCRCKYSSLRHFPPARACRGSLTEQPVIELHRTSLH